MWHSGSDPFGVNFCLAGSMHLPWKKMTYTVVVVVVVVVVIIIMP
jgi:hypothetical protein